MVSWCFLFSFAGEMANRVKRTSSSVRVTLTVSTISPAGLSWDDAGRETDCWSATPWISRSPMMVEYAQQVH